MPDASECIASLLVGLALVWLLYLSLIRCLHHLTEKLKALLCLFTDSGVPSRPPEFLKGLSNVECKERESVQFRCKVTGCPQPRVLWYKDGHRLRNSQICKIGEHSDFCHV